jgi:hypothetical protein
MVKKKVEISTQDLTTILTTALSKIMDWMPEENRSKAILIPDPRNPEQLLAVHNGPDGIVLLVGDGYQGFIDEILCDDCKASLLPYSVIYTGLNIETGEFDPEAYVGLHGAHDEDVATIETDEEPDLSDSVFTTVKAQR